jgi:hypothetical protein
MNLDKARNAIKVVGEPVNKVTEILKDINPYTEAPVNGAVVRIRMDVFDELDEIVFSYLKDAYYESFKTSTWWVKHFQYLCIAERKVVEDDFAIFRGTPVCVCVCVCVSVCVFSCMCLLMLGSYLRNIRFSFLYRITFNHLLLIMESKFSVEEASD